MQNNNGVTDNTDKTDFEDFLSYMDGKENGDTPGRKELVLDIESPLETSLTGVIIVFICISFGLFFTRYAQWIALPLFTMAGLVYLRFNLDDHYVLNSQEKKIYFKRKVFNREDLTLVAEFSDIYAATTSGDKRQVTKNKYRWFYAAIIILNTGRIIRVTEYLQDNFTSAKAIAQKTADLLDIPFIPGELETYTQISRDKNTGEIRVSFDNYLTYFAKSQLIWFIIIAIIFLIFFSVLNR